MFYRLSQLVMLLCFFVPSISFTDTLPVEVFATPPDISDVTLSPDGQNLAFRHRLSGDDTTGTAIRVYNTDSGQIKDLAYATPDDFVVNWIRWANNEVLLMSAIFAGERNNIPTEETRLVAIDLDSGKHRSVLGNRYLRKHDHIPQFQDRVIDILKSDDDHILLSLRVKFENEYRVLRVNIKNSRVKEVEFEKSYVYHWMTDEQERVRIAYWNKGTEYRVMHKDLESQKWQTLWEFESFAEDQIWPLGFGKNPNTLYVSAYHDGRAAIFKVDVRDPELNMELVFSHPRYDADGSLVYSSVTGDVIGTRFSTGSGYTFWDEEYTSLQESIDMSLPNTNNVFYDFSDDERYYVLSASSDTDPGTYYIGDRENNSAKPFARRYLALDPQQMADKTVIRYEARDGLQIEGVLTRPNGGDDSPVPTIVFPHGGPISFDGGGFDYWTQYFASRGYAVLQMNFRGSAGYGYEFMASGLQAWGLEMQNDVEDGTRWLIEEGIADPERICVVGGSYGGYAALMEAARNPDLYRCAVSFAGVTDVAYLVRSSRRYTNARIVEEQIGNDMSSLRERSPITHADQIDIPVLLGHGTDDRSVRIQHGRRMNDALEDHDKDVTYLEFEDGDHYLSNEEHRLAFFKAMDSFLQTHLN